MGLQYGPVARGCFRGVRSLAPDVYVVYNGVIVRGLCKDSEFTAHTRGPYC